MAQETNNNTFQYPSTLQELLDDMQSGRYSHLQFILNRKKHHNLGMGQKYLVVNNIGFGLYELNCVDYSNGIIKMIVTNPDTGNTSEITLDVRNKHPETYLINWTDIEDMVYAERNFDCADDDLLELEDE
jgi:hypothetical protein